MRALKKKKRNRRRKKKCPACLICKYGCVDNNVQKQVKVTRSFTKFLELVKEFIIIEIYRCMPLLGNEQDNAPDWDVHIVRYAIMFTNLH